MKLLNCGYKLFLSGLLVSTLIKMYTKKKTKTNTRLTQTFELGMKLFHVGNYSCNNNNNNAIHYFVRILAIYKLSFKSFFNVFCRLREAYV